MINTNTYNYNRTKIIEIKGYWKSDLNRRIGTIDVNRQNSWEFTDRFQFFIRLSTLTTIHNNHKTKQTIDKKRWYFCHHLCEKKPLVNSLPNGNPFQIRNPTNNQKLIKLRNV